MDFTIRQERSGDYEAVYQLVKEAFLTAEHADGDEQDLVNRLRGGDSYLPELSLVAVSQGEIVGHIMFTECQIAGTTQLTLAPLAVLPRCQRMGVGGRLIEEGHRIARALGYEFSVLLGHASYYPRFGYLPASRYGISAPFEVADENFMAFRLTGERAALPGVVRFAAEFGI